MPRSKVAIIDYGAGNLQSVEGALQHIGAEVVVTRDSSDLKGCSHLVLPGVGSMARALNVMRGSGIADEIKERSRDGDFPILGICLGMQLLATRGEEGGIVDGLDLIPGAVERLSSHEVETKVPRIGWFDVESVSCSTRPCLEIPEGPYYFAHSYIFRCTEPGCETAESRSGPVTLTAAIQKGRTFGTQFHPEKSGQLGLAVLQSFTLEA